MKNKLMIFALVVVIVIVAIALYTYLYGLRMVSVSTIDESVRRAEQPFADPQGTAEPFLQRIEDLVQKLPSQGGTSRQITDVVMPTPTQPSSTRSVPPSTEPAPVPIQEATNIQITDGVKHTVPLDKILDGGPPKDGIPSLDAPKFELVSQASDWIDEDGLGIAVSFGGVNRFYPNQILVWHEIVNDTVGGQAALISYCPLCGTGVVYDPVVKGQVTDFGTSGKLYQSNLVMYDRQTDSYWSQVLGESIVGEMAGTKLNLLPHENLLYKDWVTSHPNGEVLSRETGFSRDYTKSPYGDYDSNRSLFYPVDNMDDRYHPKAPMMGLEVNGEHAAFLVEELDNAPSTFTYQLGEKNIRVQYDQQTKTAQFTDTETGARIISVYGFWFSWFSVHPDTLVYEAS